MFSVLFHRNRVYKLKVHLAWSCPQYCACVSHLFSNFIETLKASHFSRHREADLRDFSHLESAKTQNTKAIDALEFAWPQSADALTRRCGWSHRWHEMRYQSFSSDYGRCTCDLWCLHISHTIANNTALTSRYGTFVWAGGSWLLWPLHVPTWFRWPHLGVIFCRLCLLSVRYREAGFSIYTYSIDVPFLSE